MSKQGLLQRIHLGHGSERGFYRVVDIESCLMYAITFFLVNFILKYNKTNDQQGRLNSRIPYLLIKINYERGAEQQVESSSKHNYQKLLFRQSACKKFNPNPQKTSKIN